MWPLNTTRGWLVLLGFNAFLFSVLAYRAHETGTAKGVAGTVFVGLLTVMLFILWRLWETCQESIRRLRK